MDAEQRTLSGPADLREMAALARAFPADTLHVVDLPYRLSSWALDRPETTGLWFDAGGRLLAWAVMQTPFWTVDYAIHTRARDALRQILAWADERAGWLRETAYGHPQWYVNVFADQAERIHKLEEAGYTSQAHVGEDSWSKVSMRRSARLPVADHPLPAGFAIRPLEGENEVEAYVHLHRSVFQSTAMTPEWRTRTLHRPEYLADLDLVAVARDGRLAAFCICWLDTVSGDPCGQVEPLGVHQDWRGLGLGQALLSAGLRQLQLRGARQMVVETDRYRNAALGLYRSAGFRVRREVLVFRKDYGVAPSAQEGQETP